MPKVTYTEPDGNVVEIAANTGDSVMETAMRNGVRGMVAECGGSLSCATCHVFVRDDEVEALPAMEEMEDEMLWGTAVDRRENSRLSCQIRVTDDMDLHVALPATQV